MTSPTTLTLTDTLRAYEIGTEGEFEFDAGDVLRVVARAATGSARSVVVWVPAQAHLVGAIGPMRVNPLALDLATQAAEVEV